MTVRRRFVVLILGATVALVLALLLVRMSTVGLNAEKRSWCAANIGPVLAEMAANGFTLDYSLGHMFAIEDYLSGTDPREVISESERGEIDRGCSQAYARFN